MNLALPNLDDRTFADLVAEAKSLLPSLAPDWTDFNPTDPGITLIELFAWLTEMLLYRTNRLPDENVRTFLRLLRGPDWKPSGDLAADVRDTIVDLRQLHRAVTADDYEKLALAASPQVVRARVVPRRNLDALAEEARTALRPGYVSVIVVPARPAATDSLGQPVPPAASDLPPLLSETLRQQVAEDLEPRRLLTVRNVVVGPIYVPVQPAVVLAGRADVPPDLVRAQVKAAIDGFLDPLTGGEGNGWPFGRDVYVSEIFQLLEALPGVDYVTDVSLASVLPAAGSVPADLLARSVAATPLWHESGDEIGLALEAHHLPWSRVDAQQIVVGAVFVRVRVDVQVVYQPTYPLVEAVAQQRVKAAVVPLFHPRLGGPDGSAAKDITNQDVEAAVAASPGGANIASVTVTFTSDRRFDGPGTTSGVHVALSELVDWSISVEVS